MAPEEARRQALLKFGNVALAKEDTRRVWVWAWLDEARQDLRYAARTLRKSPRFYDDCGRHTGAGDWRQHRHVQRRECGSAPAPSVSVAGAVGDVVDRGSDAEPSRGQIGTVGCRTVAESKSELRGHGHLRYRGHDVDRRRRGGTDRRRQHLPQPALAPRCPARPGAQLFERRSRAAATTGPDQSSLLASAIRQARTMRSARRSCSTAFLPRSSASFLLISKSRGSMQTCGSRTRPTAACAADRRGSSSGDFGLASRSSRPRRR